MTTTFAEGTLGHVLTETKDRDTAQEFRLAFFVGWEDKTRDLYHNLWAKGDTPMADQAYRAGWQMAKIEHTEPSPA